MAKVPDFSNEPIEAEDIDLEETEVIVGGERLTDERAEQLAEETLAEVRARREARTKHLVPGGKSLTGGSTHSPVLNVRVPAELKSALDEQARAQSMGTSKLVRSILEDWAQAQQRAEADR
ncbi:ribbon-helix-helix protein, CopG family [Gordonia soli]|nr:ribbon-helix-helix protein, CopG family [Gordonia soli]